MTGKAGRVGVTAVQVGVTAGQVGVTGSEVSSRKWQTQAENQSIAE